MCGDCEKSCACLWRNWRSGFALASLLAAAANSLSNFLRHPGGGHYPTFPLHFSPIVVLTTHNLHASVWTVEPLQACVKRNKLSLLFDFHRWTDGCELWEQQLGVVQDGKRWIVCVYFFRNHASQTAVAPSAKQRDSWGLAVYVFFLRKHAFERCCCLNIAKEVPEASLLAVETAIAPSRTGLSIADGGQEANIQMLSNRHHG